MKYVAVYRNLKHGRKARPLYSILYNGRVIARRHRVLISGATFVVREAGRQRVLREGRKNVHAFVKGILVDSRGIFGIDANSKKPFPVKISYNPYQSANFITEDGHPVTAARGVLLNEQGITACYLD